MSNDRLQSFGHVRSIDDENRRVEVVVSTGEVARDGMVIDPRGWDLRAYERNPVVLWGHDDFRQPPIARTVESRITDEALIQVHEFDAPGNDPFADTIFNKIRAGLINATSVRWTRGLVEVRKMAVKGSDGKERTQDVVVFVRGHQLLETSYVSIPADPGALVLRSDGARIDVREFITPEPATEAVQEISLAERLLRGFVRATGGN